MTACGFPSAVQCYALASAAEYLGVPLRELKRLVAACEIVSHTATDGRRGGAVGETERFISLTALEDFTRRRGAKKGSR